MALGRRPKSHAIAQRKASNRCGCLRGYDRMGKLANVSGKEAARAFEKAGWQEIGQVGSHLVMTKSGVRVNLSIPQHKELSNLIGADPILTTCKIWGLSLYSFCILCILVFFLYSSCILPPIPAPATPKARA